MSTTLAVAEDFDRSRLTPKQRATLARLERWPWTRLVPDARFFALLDRYEREAVAHEAEVAARRVADERAEQEAAAQVLVEEQHRYFAVIGRVTTYDGPDYRVRFEGQQSWVRVNAWQYRQAEAAGLSCCIWSESRGLAVAA